MERKYKIALSVILIAVTAPWISLPFVKAESYLKTVSNFSEPIESTVGKEYYLAYDRLPDGETSGQKSLSFRLIADTKTSSGGFTIYAWLNYAQKNVSLIVNFVEDVAGYSSNQTNVYADYVEIIVTQLMTIPIGDWMTGGQLGLNKLLTDSFTSKGLTTAPDVWVRALPTTANELAGFNTDTKTGIGSNFVILIARANITLTAKAPQWSLGALYNPESGYDMLISGFCVLATMGGLVGGFSGKNPQIQTKTQIKKKPLVGM